MIRHQTVGRLFLKRAHLSKDHPAAGWIEGGEIKSFKFSEYKDHIEKISAGLVKFGVAVGDRVSILSQTCKEWHFLDLSLLCSRAIVIPIYPSYTSSEVAYIFNHSDSSFLVIENDAQFEKLQPHLSELKLLKGIISIQELSEANKQQIASHIHYNHFKEILQGGIEHAKNNPDLFENTIKSQSEEEVATIIYTSGTTGEPKGAIITQEAFTMMLDNVKHFVQGAFSEKDRTLTFLPLSHVLGRCDSFLPLVFGSQMVFAESMDKVVDNLNLVQPTIMIAVPRVFEKIYNKIWEQIHQSHMIKRVSFDLAMKAARNYFSKIDQDRSPTAAEILSYQMAKEVVFNQIYRRFGGKIRFFVSGGAALSTEIIELLRYSGLTILEGYGLTETIAPCVLNPISRQKVGTVGRPIGDVSIKFAPDGEILIKTKALFSGYYKNPEATKEAMDGGWFHSGDIGYFTEEGYLKITDRKKDIIITSGGKNIAPQKIEIMLKAQKYISHAVVVGEGKKFLSVLIGIEKERFLSFFSTWNIPLDISLADLAQHPKVLELIQQDIDQVNHGLAQFETVKKFYILPEEINQQNYLTPSLKIKRKVITKQYEKEIAQFYQS